MPVLTLRCPDCGHEFRSLVLAGTQTPAVWNCSQCGADRVAPLAGAPVIGHPWEQASSGQQRHVYGCLCCF